MDDVDQLTAAIELVQAVYGSDGLLEHAVDIAAVLSANSRERR